MSRLPRPMAATTPALLVIVLALVAFDAFGQTGAERLGEAALLGIENRDRVDAKLESMGHGDGGVLDGGESAIGAADGGVDAGPARAPEPTEQDVAEARARQEEADALERRSAEQAADQARAADAEQAAKAAQAEALLRAAEAKSALLERILRQIAAAEGANAGIAEADQRLRTAIQTALDDAAASLKAAHADFDTANAADADPNARIHGAIDAQRLALEQTREAVSRRRRDPSARLAAKLDAVPEAAEIALSQSLTGDDREEVTRRLATLRETVTHVGRAEDALDREAAALWYEVVDARFEVAHIRNKTRLALLPRVTGENARALTGLTELGRDNLQVAVEHVATLFSVFLQRRVHDLILLPTRLTDPLFSGVLLWALMKALLVIAFAVFMRRRWPPLYLRGRKAVLGRMSNRARVKVLEGALSVAEDAAPQAGLLLLALWLRSEWSAIGPEPELSTLFGVFIWVLSYQLLAKLTNRLVVRLARRRFHLSAEQRAKILRTVKQGMRYTFAAAFALSQTKAIVGEGVLYWVARGFAVVGGVILFVVWVQRWRHEIVDMYLSRWGQSATAKLIVQYRDRWFSLPLAMVALGAVAVSAIGALAKDFILGFDQTRRALAYFFQIRVERKAKSRGRKSVAFDTLPDSLQESFRDVPCVDERFLLDRFADVDAAIADLAKSGPFALMVRAPAGGGVTTWLRQFEKRVERPVVWLHSSTRCHTRDAFDALLTSALGHPRAADVSWAQWWDTVLAGDGPAPILAIDDIERYFLRELDGYGALDELADHIAATDGRVMWVAGGRDLTVRFLNRTRSFNTAFDRSIDIAPMDEQEIQALIRQRQAVCPRTLSFEDLLVKEFDSVVDETMVVETQNGYLRLLWSFSEGNPRNALHLWTRSLVPTADGIDVQLHDAPSADVLEQLTLPERFFLQTLVLHRELSSESLASTSRSAIRAARAHVARMKGLGAYIAYENQAQHVTLSTHFHQASVRYLRRKNLL